MSMFANAGVLPRPGMRCMSPQSDDDESGAGARQHAADGQDEAGRAIAQQRVVRERQVRLRHAHLRGSHAQLLDSLQVLDGLHLQIDAGRAIQPLRDRFDLLHDRRARRA